MRIIAQGQESLKTIESLIELTRVKENIQGGLIDYFVRNFSISDAAMLNGLKHSNLSVAIKDLNKVALIVERIIEERMR